MDLYRSTKKFRTEEVESMGIVNVHVIGIDDNMTYAVLGHEDFERQYEPVPEEVVPEEPLPEE